MPLNNYNIALNGNILKERQFCALHGYLIQCYLDFEIYPLMSVIVEGLKEEPKIVIKKAKPVSLSEESLEILKSL